MVLPSTSNNEIFLENHAGKFTVVLPKEINLDEELYWEMALVELFWPKQDSLTDRENLWYGIQESKRKWKRTHIPTSLCEQFVRLCKARFNPIPHGVF